MSHSVLENPEMLGNFIGQKSEPPDMMIDEL